MKLLFRLLVSSILFAACSSTQISNSQITPSAPVMTASMSEPTSLPTTQITMTPIPIFMEEENRNLYLVWDIGNSNASDYPEFWTEYDLAIQHDEFWIQDPLHVALHFLHPSTVVSEPGCLKEEVAYLPTTEERKAIFIFLQSHCGDDSLGMVKLRIELSQRDKIWKIDWFGGMKKCRRGSEDLKNHWHTQICS